MNRNYAVLGIFVAVLLIVLSQTFFVVGVFVAVYNYLAFRLEAAPFALPPALVSLLFLTYLAGTATSRLAGVWAPRLGPRVVMRIGVAAMIVGLLVMLSELIVVVVIGLVLVNVLRPGDGVYVRPDAPHFVRNGPEPSVSFSITWRTPATARASRVHRTNGRLRSLGITPRRPGHSPARDRVKAYASSAATAVELAARRVRRA